MLAGKTFARASTDMQTRVAHLGGIARIMQHHWDRRQIGLIANEFLQLVKRPSVAAPFLHLAPLLLVRALPNARQVFEYHHGTFALGGLHNVVADLVVGLPLESLLSLPDSRLRSPRHLRRVLRVPFVALRSSAARNRL